MRICLIVAILAALGAGTLNVLQVRDKINTLISQRDEYHTKLTQTPGQTDEHDKRGIGHDAEALWSRRKQQLTDCAGRAEKGRGHRAAAQPRSADDLSDKLAKATQDRDAAQADLAAYKATGKSPEEIVKLIVLDQAGSGRRLPPSTRKRRFSPGQSPVCKTELNELHWNGIMIVKLPADLKGKVVVVDPKWDFVVLDIGDDQGVLEDGELLVSRDGKLVAKVVVRTVEKDRCIANIVPGWKLGEVFEGDEVTPAHPAS